MYGRAGSSGDTEKTTPKPVPQTPTAQTRNAPAAATHSDRRNTTTRNHPRGGGSPRRQRPAEHHAAAPEHQPEVAPPAPRAPPLQHHQHTATRQRLAQRPSHRMHTPQRPRTEAGGRTPNSTSCTSQAADTPQTPTQPTTPHTRAGHGRPRSERSEPRAGVSSPKPPPHQGRTRQTARRASAARPAGRRVQPETTRHPTHPPRQQTTP